MEETALRVESDCLCGGKFGREQAGERFCFCSKSSMF